MKTSKEEVLKEKGYDVRQILNYFPKHPEKLEYLAETDYTISDILLDVASREDEDRFIDKIYEIIKRNSR